MAGMTRKWMWVRCGLEGALVLFYIHRVPFIIRVCRYKLHHESPSCNAEWLFGTALALAVFVLIAWDCRRHWRRLQRMRDVGLAK